MKKLKNNKIDLAVIVLIIIYSFAIWWPTRFLPYHWDSAGYVINAARQFLKNNFSTLIPEVGLVFAHPPLFNLGLAFIWKLFGINFLVSHLYVAVYLPILMISTYFIGKKIKDWQVGLTSSFLVGMVAIVVSEYGLVYLDLPLAALVAVGFALSFYQKYIISGIFISIAVLFKVPAVLILPAIFLPFFDDKKLRKNWQFYFSLWLPVLFLGIWLWYHYQETGWLLFKPDRPSPRPRNFSQFIDSFFFVCKHFFVTQGKWLITLVGALSMFLLFLNNNLKKAFETRIIQLFTVILTGVLFYTWAGEFALRYGIFMLPAFVVLVMYFLKISLKYEELFFVVSVVCGILLIINWHPKLKLTEKYEFRASEDMSYQDFIKIGKAAAQFLEINFPQAVIYGSFPESYQVSQPYQGYVRRAFEFHQCMDFKIENRLQILYLHPYSPGQYYCRLLIEKVANRPLKRFESNGKWMELYLVTASPSAQIK